MNPMPRKSNSRELMVGAAARLMRRQGYAATGWRQVVAESGAPWGSQAHFFPGGKVELAAEALTLEGDRIRAELESALAEAHPARMIRAWARAAVRQLEASGWTEGCPIATTALEITPGSDALSPVCQEAFASWQATFADAIAARGVSRREARSLATLLVAATEGALLMARTSRSPAPLTLVAAQLAALLTERVP
jgi:TetR/AcrR family transcriptional repressor of lmrAB and yxaGH operons